MKSFAQYLQKSTTDFFGATWTPTWLLRGNRSKEILENSGVRLEVQFVFK